MAERLILDTTDSELHCHWCVGCEGAGKMNSSVDQIVIHACNEHSTSLNLSHLDIAVVPLQLANAKDLLCLQLNNNRLIMPPEEVGGLDQLQELSLDHNQLTILPSSLFHLVHLTYLNISYNPLSNVSPIVDFSSVIMLKPSANKKYILWNMYLPNACCFQPQSIAHWWLSRSCKFKGHRANKKPIDPIWPPLCPTLYLSYHSRYLMWKFCDLDLERFKVIQGQRWWCQLTAHGWLPIRLLLTPTSYLSPFLKYLTCIFNDLELELLKVIHSQNSWWKLESYWWFPIWPPCV